MKDGVEPVARPTIVPGKDDFIPKVPKEGVNKKHPLHFIAGLTHYLIVGIPFAVLGAVYYFLGLEIFAVCLAGSVYRLYRVVLNNSGGGTDGPELDNWTIKTGVKEAIKKRVAVIGAGASGLTATKSLLEEGHDVNCYDTDKEIGGVFENGFWPGGCLTSSPYVTAYSDFEPPKDKGGKEHWNHYTKEEYVDYLRGYVNEFGFRENLCLGKRVLHAQQKEEGGKIVFYLQVQDVTDGTVVVDGPFDHIAVTTGLNSNPRVDDRLPGFKGFTGKVLHSTHFANAKTFDDAFKDVSGKTVVTIGLGESMADILGAMCDRLTVPPKRCVASVRSGAFVIPRINPLTGLNNDFDTIRLRYALPKVSHNFAFNICTYLSNLFPRKQCPESEAKFYLFRNIRKNGPARTIATKSAKFIPAVVRGDLELKRGISKIEGSNVHFTDGSVVENVDVLVYGCGFKAPVFPFFDEETFKPSGLSPPCSCATRRFLRMFEPNLGDSVGFIGYGRPLIGTIPTVSEIQGRLFAQVVSGKRALPSEAVMKKKAEKDRAKWKKEFQPWNPNWEGLVNWIPYMDSIAQEVGCRPKRTWMLTKPILANKLVTGPMTTFHYRLTGPHAKFDMAREVIMRIPYSGRGVDAVFFYALHWIESLFTWPLTLVYDFVYFPMAWLYLLISSPCRRTYKLKAPMMSESKKMV